MVTGQLWEPSFKRDGSHAPSQPMSCIISKGRLSWNPHRYFRVKWYASTWLLAKKVTWLSRSRLVLFLNRALFFYPSVDGEEKHLCKMNVHMIWNIFSLPILLTEKRSGVRIFFFWSVKGLQTLLLTKPSGMAFKIRFCFLSVCTIISFMAEKKYFAIPNGFSFLIFY